MRLARCAARREASHNPTRTDLRVLLGSCYSRAAMNESKPSLEQDREADRAGADTPDRITLLRDMVVLQFKLVVDGLRDFVLVPVSLVVGLISLFKVGDKPGTEFYDLLRYGRQSDRIINLFGAAQRVHRSSEQDVDLPDIDDLVGKVETFVVDEYRRGDMSKQAKDRIDQLIAAVNRGRPGPEDGSGR